RGAQTETVAEWWQRRRRRRRRRRGQFHSEVDPGPDPELSHLPTPRNRSGPLLSLKLFITEDYDQKRVGPCVVTAGHRVYVEVCQLNTNYRHQCVSVSLTGAGVGPLRFSFLLRPVHNDSVHFLHCSLSVCVYGPPAPQSTEETAKIDCGGRQRIPPLLRNLYRPMVVTQPISSLAPKLLGPPAGQRHHSSESSSSGPSVLLVLMGSVNPTPCLPGFLLHTGPVMGIIFTAFVMGVGLMGATESDPELSLIQNRF
uniref:ZP domain-containing protein n=1 Tax=Cynoglossus semilaevis TaxID=244447 RepID=A0A3P8WCW0_CYNSE